MANEYKLGNVEFYLGLEATGKTVTVDNSAVDVAPTDTSFDVSGDIAEIAKGDKITLLKPDTLDEYLFVVSETSGTLTVKRDRLKHGAVTIPDGTVLSEMKFVKRTIDADGFSVDDGVLTNPKTVMSQDGIEEFLYDVEEEEFKFEIPLIKKSDIEYIDTTFPVGLTIDTSDGDETVTYQGTAEEYDQSTHLVPALLCFSNVGYENWHKVFPKVTLLRRPSTDYAKGEVFKKTIELVALKHTLPNGKRTYAWSVKKVS